MQAAKQMQPVICIRVRNLRSPTCRSSELELQLTQCVASDTPSHCSSIPCDEVVPVRPTFWPGQVGPVVEILWIELEFADWDSDNWLHRKTRGVRLFRGLLVDW